MAAHRRHTALCAVLVLCAGLSTTDAQHLSDSLVKAQALAHLGAERYGEAIRVLDGYIAAKPDDADGYYLRGICNERRARFAEAAADYRKASTLTKENREMLNSLSRVETAWQSDLRSKLDGYLREVALKPGEDSYKRMIAACYADLGKASEAEMWYDRYFAARKGTPPEILAYADLLAKAGRLPKAETVLRGALTRFPENSLLYTQLGYVALWSGRQRQAMTEFDKALRYDPANRRAREGLAEARTPRPVVTRPRTSSPAPNEPAAAPSLDYYHRLVQITPADHEARFALANELAKANRFTEASEQLDTLAAVFARSERLRRARAGVRGLRDSVYRSRVNQGLQRLARDPSDKQTVLELADSYDAMQRYDSTIAILDGYARRIGPRDDPDIAFASARHAAWNNEFSAAIPQLDALIRNDPDRLDYQLLRGQIAVWTMKDFELAERFLKNVRDNNPAGSAAYITLASLYTIKADFPSALWHLERARQLDPSNRELHEEEEYYHRAKLADRDRRLYALLDSARAMAHSGACRQALPLYERYVAAVAVPARAVWLEIADAKTCAGDFMGAIAILDVQLAGGYDFNLALRRATNLLWGGDSAAALLELSRLAADKPEDFTARLYLGDAQVRVGKRDIAKRTYLELQRVTMDSARQAMLTERLESISRQAPSLREFHFPNYAAVAPSVSVYSDNADFLITASQARAEIGSLGILSLGVSGGMTGMRSPVSTRRFTTVMGRALVGIMDGFSLEGGLGIQSTPGHDTQTVGDAALRCGNDSGLAVTASFQSVDASQVLYSTELVDVRMVYKDILAHVSYVPSVNLQLNAQARYITLSDGNDASELLFSIGKTAYGQVLFTYEYEYTNYARQADTSRTHAAVLYYSPQHLHSHAILLDWHLAEGKDGGLLLGGKLGYIPQFDALIREVRTAGRWQPGTSLVINASLALGSTYRFTSQYDYVSAGLSAYWSF